MWLRSSVWSGGALSLKERWTVKHQSWDYMSRLFQQFLSSNINIVVFKMKCDSDYNVLCKVWKPPGCKLQTKHTDHKNKRTKSHRFIFLTSILFNLFNSTSDHTCLYWDISLRQWHFSESQLTHADSGAVGTIDPTRSGGEETSEERLVQDQHLMAATTDSILSI